MTGGLLMIQEFTNFATSLLMRFPSVACPAYGVERKAGPGLTAVALDFQPAQPAAEALADGWRGLSRPP